MSPVKIRTIPAAQFKAKCLALIAGLQHSEDEIIITVRGRPVAKVVPYDGFGDAEVDWGELLGPEHFALEEHVPERVPLPDLRGSILYEAEDAWQAHPDWWRRPN